MWVARDFTTFLFNPNETRLLTTAGPRIKPCTNIWFSISRRLAYPSVSAHQHNGADGRLRELESKICVGNHDAAVLGDLALELFNPFARQALEWT